MATTKTLTPTNQTITIAGFQGEKPDQRQVADTEGKLADAINALNSQLVKTVKVTYTPSSNIAAGESGMFTVPVPATVKGKTIVAVSFGINHVGQAYGYQVSGTYISTLDDAYISYYAPRAVTAANADFDMTIAYI